MLVGNPGLLCEVYFAIDCPLRRVLAEKLEGITCNAGA